MSNTSQIIDYESNSAGYKTLLVAILLFNINETRNDKGWGKGFSFLNSYRGNFLARMNYVKEKRTFKVRLYKII